MAEGRRPTRAEIQTPFTGRQRRLGQRLADNEARVDAQYQEGLRIANEPRDPKPETPGQVWGRITRSMVTHALAFEATKHNPLSPGHERAKEGLATGRDEFRATFFKGDDMDGERERTFAKIIEGRVEDEQTRLRESVEDAEHVQIVGRVIAEKRQAMRGDWGIIRQEFPGQYEEPDYEHQSRLGDVPPRFGKRLPTNHDRGAAFVVNRERKKKQKEAEKKDDDED